MVDRAEEKVAQYKTIRRLPKNFLVRCGESLTTIIPGTGVKPVSAIRRVEHEIAKLRKELGTLTEQELLNQMDRNSKAQRTQELTLRRNELQELIRGKEKELLSYELL